MSQSRWERQENMWSSQHSLYCRNFLHWQKRSVMIPVAHVSNAALVSAVRFAAIYIGWGLGDRLCMLLILRLPAKEHLRRWIASFISPVFSFCQEGQPLQLWNKLWYWIKCEQVVTATIQMQGITDMHEWEIISVKSNSQCYQAEYVM